MPSTEGTNHETKYATLFTNRSEVVNQMMVFGHFMIFSSLESILAIIKRACYVDDCDLVTFVNYNIRAALVG
jgi:hypothetical protein